MRRSSAAVSLSRRAARAAAVSRPLCRRPRIAVELCRSGRIAGAAAGLAERRRDDLTANYSGKLKMIAVIFEVWPKADRKKDYLDIGAELRPNPSAAQARYRFHAASLPPDFAQSRAGPSAQIRVETTMTARLDVRSGRSG